MASQIHVTYKAEDGRATRILAGINALGKVGKGVSAVHVVDTYTVDARLTPKQREAYADALYTPLSQKYTINKPLAPSAFSYAIEVGFLPGVTDNVGHTAKETLEDTLKKKLKDDERVYYSQTFFLTGQLDEKDTEEIAASLHNPLIQRVTIKSKAAFKKDGGMGVVIPKVKLSPGKVTEVDLYVSDEELAVLGKKGIQDKDGSYRGPLGLGVEELKAIRNYFHKLGRNPNDIEIEALAQTWSEHCKHTIFANPLDEIKDGIYKHYIKRATKEVRKKKGKKDFCVSVFSDNSGVIEFDDDTYITHKVETHNSPSALDPFGGAITGIVGVNRDTIGTGLGAKPLLNMYGYCFADPADTTRLFRDEEMTQELLSAHRIMDGVVEGVNAGGNESGIPTPQGFTFFEKRYRGKPLVFVGTVGVMPKKVKGKPSYEKEAKAGDYIVMLGGRVGLDGIHGATFSSEALDSGSPATAVQIGDAITQKKFSDAVVKEARDLGLYNSITDNGAGGLSSSVGEMAEQSGGCEVWLEKVPVKYGGLAPWQIWISESQERMTLAVPKRKWKAFQKLMRARGSEATVIGEFTSSGKCVVKNRKKTILELDMDFMHGGNPVHLQFSKKPERTFAPVQPTVFKKYEKNIGEHLLALLKRANVGSTEYISSQYDHEVQGVSVTKPLHGRGRVNAPASVSRPTTETKKGIVLSQGLNPRYSDIDTFHMAASSVDQAIRNVVAIGADPSRIALLDNFCWCSSNEPERLFELKEAARACYEYATAFEAPFISGKDSMFNDFKGFDEHRSPIQISVPPTLLISSIGIMDDVSEAVTLDFKVTGSGVYLLGETKAELSGGEFFAYMEECDGNAYADASVPTVDAKRNAVLYDTYHKALQKNLVASALPLDRGGLAVALMKSAIGGQLGVSVDVDAVGGTDLPSLAKLFSESNGRILVSVRSENEKAFQKMMGKIASRIGEVNDAKEVRIVSGKQKVAALKLDAATKAYRSKFKNA